MRTRALMITAVLGFSLAGGTSAARAAELYLKDMAAEVRVTPEARGDIAVRVVAQDPRYPRVQVRRTPQGVVVDGGLPRRNRACNGFGRRRPQTIIEVRAPVDIAVRANGAVRGSIGSARDLSLTTEGCGDWRLQNARRLDLRLEGLGDVDAGRVGPAKIAVEGLGHANLQSVSGPLDISVEGLGGVRVREGRVAHMTARLEGLGSINFGGVADSLDARADGVGSIRVARVLGRVTKNRDGISRIKVGRQG